MLNNIGQKGLEGIQQYVQCRKPQMLSSSAYLQEFILWCWYKGTCYTNVWQFMALRLGAHWQLNSCTDKKVAVTVRALQLKSCLYGQLFFSQYGMDFTQTACVCALLLRIRKDRPKKRHWVHPVVSKRLSNGQFYKLYEDLRNCKGNIFSYFRMSIESSDKLLVLVRPWIIYENYFAFRDLQCEVKGTTVGRNTDI